MSIMLLLEIIFWALTIVVPLVWLLHKIELRYNLLGKVANSQYRHRPTRKQKAQAYDMGYYAVACGFLIEKDSIKDVDGAIKLCQQKRDCEAADYYIHGMIAARNDYNDGKIEELTEFIWGFRNG